MGGSRAQAEAPDVLGVRTARMNQGRPLYDVA